MSVQFGDITQSAVGAGEKASYTEKLARFQLLNLKMQARGATEAEIKGTLGNMSELEQINAKVLKEISKYSESTPEFAQLYNMTGSKDRFEQCEWLSEKIYEQTRSEAIMSFYTPDKAEIRETFYNNTLAGIDARGAKVRGAVARVASTRSAASGAASQLLASFGGRGETSAPS